MSNYCDDLNDLLWLTIGHEFFHAIQYSYRTSFNDSYFRELTSMWFENIFVPECFDFLEFVDMSSSSLFNTPENGFDENTSGSYGYSLSLFAHYLSTITDILGTNSQLNSNIIREIWEDYSDASSNETIFKSLRDVLENNYDTSFPHTWSDFMSRNMFCGEFEDMDNDIYYHIGQSLIDPPDFNYEPSFSGQSAHSLLIDDDRVSFIGFEADQVISIDASFSSSENSLWYGLLSDNYIFSELTGGTTFNTDITSYPSKIFFMFISNDDEENIEIDILIDIEGCTDPYASNYNESANIDNGSCFYIEGCTDPYASNYNESADIDDDSCVYSDYLLSVYPNPVNLRLYPLSFVYILSEEKNIKLSILDLNGKKIKEEEINNLNIGKNIVEITNLSYLPCGIYFILIDNSQPLKFLNIK